MMGKYRVHNALRESLADEELLQPSFEKFKNGLMGLVSRFGELSVQTVNGFAY
jgi:hypothetical protein